MNMEAILLLTLAIEYLGLHNLGHVIDQARKDNLGWSSEPPKVSYLKEGKRMVARISVWLKRYVDNPDLVGAIANQFALLYDREIANRWDVEVIHGEAIITAYRDGPNSCMSDKPASYLSLYVDNPDRFGLSIARERHTGNIEGRALLVYKVDMVCDGTMFTANVQDRKYAVNEGARRALREWALNKGYFVKTEDTYGYYPFVNEMGIRVERMFFHWEDIYIRVPYMDSFQYYNAVQKRFQTWKPTWDKCAYLTEPGLRLDRALGGEVFCRSCDRYVRMEDYDYDEGMCDECVQGVL